MHQCVPRLGMHYIVVLLYHHWGWKYSCPLAETASGLRMFYSASCSNKWTWHGFLFYVGDINANINWSTYMWFILTQIIIIPAFIESEFNVYIGSVPFTLLFNFYNNKSYDVDVNLSTESVSPLWTSTKTDGSSSPDKI